VSSSVHPAHVEASPSDARPSPWTVAGFRPFIVSMVLVTLANQIQGTVVAYQIYELTRDPLSLGAVGLAEALPFVSLALLGGHVADAHDRRRVSMMSLVLITLMSLCLLGFTLGGAEIGDELKSAAARQRVKFSVRLRSIVAVDHLELVCNGRVVRSFITRTPIDHGDFSGSIALKESGWCVARASTDAGRYPVLDAYVYATTSPIYVTVAGRRPRSPDDARYFAAWIDRMSETTSAYPDWNNAAEKHSVLERLTQSKAVFVGLE